jgi:hypothetical protein
MELRKENIMNIKILQGYKKETVKRAQKMIDIMLDNPDKIGDREFDNCGEMGDGKDVGFLVMNTLVENNIFFENLPRWTQQYFGRTAWEKWEKDFLEQSSAQQKIDFDL